MARKQPEDPRRPGGIYWDGYWSQPYTVVARTPDLISVQWHDGRITEHGTAWDARMGDRVVSQPTTSGA